MKRPNKKKLDFKSHIKALRKSLPPGRFHIVVQDPFVVIGDESENRVKSRAIKTVKWAVDLLKKAYFPKNPDHIIDIWLFKGKESYETNCVRLWGRKPATPFGYYSPANRALVMNIATGGGTLVHEIVHPFMAANFPGCPAWFNEGLGSLYEQCNERRKKIMGLTNWRLDGLQEAIRARRLPSFETIIKTTDSEFYNEDRGSNYAQARYLLYYLGEKGLLRGYYKAFFKARKQDPSGFESLKTLLGVRDMAAFQAKWEKQVLRLRFE